MRLWFALQPGLLRLDGRPPPPPPGPAPGEVPQPRPKSELVIGRDGGSEALGGSRLAHHPTGPSLGHPEALPEGPNGLPASVRG